MYKIEDHATLHDHATLWHAPRDDSGWWWPVATRCTGASEAPTRITLACSMPSGMKVLGGGQLPPDVLASFFSSIQGSPFPKGAGHIGGASTPQKDKMQGLSPSVSTMSNLSSMHHVAASEGPPQGERWV